MNMYKAANGSYHSQNFQAKLITCKVVGRKQSVRMAIYIGEMPEKIGEVLIVRLPKKFLVTSDRLFASLKDHEIDRVVLQSFLGVRSVLPTFQDLQGWDVSIWEDAIDQQIDWQMDEDLRKEFLQMAEPKQLPVLAQAVGA